MKRITWTSIPAVAGRGASPIWRTASFGYMPSIDMRMKAQAHRPARHARTQQVCGHSHLVVHRRRRRSPARIAWPPHRLGRSNGAEISVSPPTLAADGCESPKQGPSSMLVVVICVRAFGCSGTDLRSPTGDRPPAFRRPKKANPSGSGGWSAADRFDLIRVIALRARG